MKFKKDIIPAKTAWVSSVIPCTWTKSRTIDTGMKMIIETDNEKDIFLTEEDLHFYPSQSQLRNYNYYTNKEIAKKLFLQKYELREVDKSGKIINKTLKITILD